MQLLYVGPILIGAAFALAYGLTNQLSGHHGFRFAAKVLSVWALAAWTGLNGGPWLLVAALLASSVGDGFLAMKNMDKWLLPGMAAFFAAHVAYVFLFSNYLPGNLPEWGTAHLILIVIAVLYVGLISSRLGDMRWPVYAYASVIIAMGCAALSLPETYRWATVGAIAFIASDMILSLELFVLEEGAQARKLTSPLVWVLYWGGQAMIAYAFIPAAVS